ncbi:MULTISPECIES: fumarylacetoacetate hydrolase family protein [unclassified Halorhodospira]|uniref:fumarylacetoacetate hydrolase family protein n=1 Tax=unclassified Halorhodospira TaxID=2626748 RepID=UPI001EE7A01E|nr:MULTISPECIES: fumarylacetoacetate hydrolase family protein [unclassified Halorhodospira]MCG5540488.1 fumarylacetoacetate hydrolase family protein [Halorhodospira sp. M39old]MCG5545016.1 fumarylacetoacetate hydrolase family protein [Halorhodospira sp. M38]
MRITTVVHKGVTRVAIHEQGDRWAVSPVAGDLGGHLCAGTLPEAGYDWPRVTAEALTFLAPLPQPPRNIMCLGLNYADHARESQQAKGDELALPEAPVVFTKATTTVAGPYADFLLDPAVTRELDWEVELGVVIGRGGRHIPESEALQHVFGYTVINDLSARDLQFRHKQFFLGKSVDGSCPMGPWITTADAVPDPHGLALSCQVNGTTQQQSHTGEMVFSIPAVIATLSRVMTLVPGDIIATGTPAGVGFARTPPRFLQAGDIVTCDVEGLGTLRNRIVAPDP